MKNLYPKKLAFLAFFILTLIATTSQAKNYYVSNTGNDANDGLTVTTPWQTITKVNTYLKNALAGDSILFKCGNTFYGSLVIAKSGTTSKPIVFGAYGSGAKPVISGFSTASGWTNVGTNLWQSAALGNTNKPNMVVINSAVAQVGRYPNYGYKTYTAHNANVSITDPTLSSSINWTGATVHIRELHDQISSDPITSHSGTTISYTNTNAYTPQDGYGYFISHSLKAVDTVNEWYFDPASKKITVYSLSSPANVKVATKDTLLLVGQSDYVTIDGISFEGANVDAISFGGPKLGQAINTTIKNCNINFSGNDAIYGTYDIGCLIDNNTINNSLNCAIELENEGGQSTNAVITGNTIKNIGLFAGMGVKYNAITIWGANALVQYNHIDSVGLTGISFYYNNVRVLNNVINHYCRTVDDAGAINVFDPSFGSTIETGREIKNNIILNGTYGVGASGTSDKADVVLGIYIDDKSNGILVEGNSVANVPRSGFYIHNGTDIIFRNNTMYNGGEAQTMLVHDNHAIGMPIRKIVFKNNILFGNQGTQMIQTIRTIRNDIDTMFSALDSNIYARPILSTGTIINTTEYYSISNKKTNFTLATWKTATYDAHTSYFTRTINSASDVRFEYNGDKSPKTISLGASYVDVRNTTYNGTITLQPFTSAILLKSGELAVNEKPVANAGADKIITLPVNYTSLSGTATDKEGTVSNFAWTKISGPASGTIATANAANTTINNLEQGIYKFELTVTDAAGATGKDTVQVTVNEAENQLPVSNAGTDNTITLPVNTVTLTGRGDDTDGTISNYSWVKISGPWSGTIANVNAATTVLYNLTEGVYQFELTVTDNKGAIGKDLVQITVNAAENQLPVSNAGTDNAITLPLNTVTLTGSGTDTDGTISSYSWVKISGPWSGTIETKNAATTVLSNLKEGVYQFELTVTDNKGAIGKDLVQVTVNEADNQFPVSNAGTDNAITLPLNTVSLTGSGNDADGTISNYSWAKISGPLSGTIADVNAATTVLNNLTEGVYQFELTVTDNKGAIGKDLVQVTVNAAENQFPVSNAGTDNTITLPVNTVTLTGRGDDADGTISNYSWVKISGPLSGTIVDVNAATTGLNNLTEGVYQFELTVTDNKGAIGKDLVQITVNAAENQLPVSNAGTDNAITLPLNTVTLTGSGTDADGTISSYSWVKVSGPASGTIETWNASTTVVSNLSEGLYQFELTVTDNNEAEVKDMVQVVVNAAENLAPLADAGTDIEITLPTSSITLTGRGDDADGTISSYSWAKVSGPSAGTVANGSSAITTVNGLAVGTYHFELTVTDDDGAIGKDIIQINVLPAANAKPIANAGADKMIILPTNSISLTGSGTHAGGPIVSYYWKRIVGPSGGIVSANAATTKVTGLSGGVYKFELSVKDNNGAVGRDTVQVTVNAVPVAKAGADKMITLPANSINLTGSGTDAGGSIVSYYWKRIAGSSGTIVSSNAATTKVTGLAGGVYKFELSVKDNNGAIGRDTVEITVNAVPVAKAGADKMITLPTISISLTGSGTDAGGSIVSYYWKRIAGPSGGIVSANAATTKVTGLSGGVYKFELSVKDNYGVIGRDTVQVTVNAVPVAKAGADKMITLPANSINLTGSGTDAGGSIVSYYWKRIAGSSGTIVSSNAATTKVTGLAGGVYKFELSVKDNNGAIGRDTVEITVNAVPVAKAGADKMITLPTISISLTGSGTDAGGSIVSYYWKRIAGPSGGIVSANAATTKVTGLSGGVYKFELSVKDNYGVIGRDTVQVTVNAVPVAKAGADKMITLPANSINLTGSGTDPGGSIVSYYWKRIAGSSGTIVSSNAATTKVTGLAGGVYKFELSVKDNNGAIGRDTVEITVNAVPVAKAGADKMITLPTNSISLTGSGTDAGGSIVSYYWKRIAGPSGGIVSANAATTKVTGLSGGVYKFELSVKDNNGAVGRDTVQVTVNAASNREIVTTDTIIGQHSLFVIESNIATGKDTVQVQQAPLVKAGNDISITSPENTTVLTGTATATTVAIKSINWIKIAGPVSVKIAGSNEAVTAVKDLVQGVYQFELSATDVNGLVAKDTVQVTVNAPIFTIGEVKNTMKVYPNPVRDIANVDITAPSKNKAILSVTDMSGRTVKQNEINGLGKDHIFRLDMSNLRNGYYIVVVRFEDGQTLNTKVVKYGGK